MTEVKPVRTVGDLIERLSEFDPHALVRLQHGLSSVADFVIGVGLIPDIPDTVGIVYMPPPESPGQ
jgi:hypothetical protein